ncbi:MAG: MFS transporter [Comamonadaceae bacterium]|nr:MFS transporter [Comamonadaceae bacterium]
MKPVFAGAVALLFVATLLMAVFLDNFTGVVATLFLFFLAFNLLEATLPSLVSKIAPAGSKGTAIGVYNSFQFLGLFLGGVLGGFLAEHVSPAVCLRLCCRAGRRLAAAGHLHAAAARRAHPHVSRRRDERNAGPPVVARTWPASTVSPRRS